MVQSETCAWAGPWLVLNLPSPTDPFRALTLGFVRGFTRGGEGKIARGQKQDPRVSASGGWWLGLNTLNSSPPEWLDAPMLPLFCCSTEQQVVSNDGLLKENSRTHLESQNKLSVGDRRRAFKKQSSNFTASFDSLFIFSAIWGQARDSRMRRKGKKSGTMHQWPERLRGEEYIYLVSREQENDSVLDLLYYNSFKSEQQHHKITYMKDL
ncbi:hypothetical protein PABG_11326 [Paracoccidioides brasiliensis Pb03]|nr:hypothetical protein PABG_11326 [Paracoccidioides brasiliensis Pb03]